jgi:hypothetical protein
VKSAFEEVTGETSPGYGIDGCSAPNFACTVTGLARAMGHFAAATGAGNARDRAMHRLTRAMAAHPVLVAGEGKSCTALMRAMSGRASVKTGAEARVYRDRSGTAHGRRPEDRGWRKAAHRRRSSPRMLDRRRRARPAPPRSARSLTHGPLLQSPRSCHRAYGACPRRSPAGPYRCRDLQATLGVVSASIRPIRPRLVEGFRQHVVHPVDPGTAPGRRSPRARSSPRSAPGEVPPPLVGADQRRRLKAVHPRTSRCR